MGAAQTSRHPLGPISLASLRSFKNFKRKIKHHTQKLDNSLPFNSKFKPTSPFQTIASWPLLIIMPDGVELSSVPPEVILGVFCSLSTFPDILHLAAACQKHRQIFHDNVITIYHYVSPRAIPCRRYARKLLEDGGSLSYENPTISDFLQMTRNFVVMEKSIDHFNEKVVAEMTRPRSSFNRMSARPMNLHLSDLSIAGYGPMTSHEGRPRLPHLTESERPRFIRAAYQMWSLILLDSTLRELRISTLKFEDVQILIDLVELSCRGDLRLILDKEMMEMEEQNLGLVADIGRISLTSAAELINAKFYFEGKRYSPLAPYEIACMGCVSIWDDWKGTFKDNILYGLKGRKQDRPVSEVWYETSDEELMG